MLPASNDHTMPFRSLQAQGQFEIEARRLAINSLKVDFQGPVASLKGAIDDIGGDMSITAESVVHNIPIDEFRRYWPRAWGTAPHEWTVSHLSDGVVTKLRAQVALESSGLADFSIRTLKGDMLLKGVTVDYLPPMPKIKNVDAKAVFSRKRFDFSITHGETLNLTIKKGKIHMTGLDQKDQYADIDLNIEGPAESALKVIEHEPIGFVSRLGFTAAKTRGRSSTRLRLNFIMEQTLTLDGIDVTAVSNMSDVSAPNVFLNQSINDGLFHLKINKEILDATGTANLGNVPTSISMKQNFYKRSPFQVRYALSSYIEDAERFIRDKFGLNFDEEDYIRGPVSANVVMTVFDKSRSQADIKLDLEDAAVSLMSIGWIKGQKSKGRIEARVSFQDEKPRTITRFQVDLSGLKATGSAKFSEDGKSIKLIKFAKASFGRSNMSGDIVFNADGQREIRLQGESFDISPMWDDWFGPAKVSPKEKKDSDSRYRLVLNFDEIILGTGRQLKNVAGTLVRRGDIWDSIFPSCRYQ